MSNKQLLSCILCTQRCFWACYLHTQRICRLCLLCVNEGVNIFVPGNIVEDIWLVVFIVESFRVDIIWSLAGVYTETWKKGIYYSSLLIIEKWQVKAKSAPNNPLLLPWICTYQTTAYSVRGYIPYLSYDRKMGVS